MKIIATHDGTFHADDVFAISLLLRKFPHSEVIRTRKPDLLEAADIRVDVGMRYCPPTDFDHHQDLSECRADGRPYASCGLIAKDFKDDLFPSTEVYLRLDRILFSSIDAQDNGMDVYAPVNGYSVYDMPRFVASFRPSARSTDGLDLLAVESMYTQAFMTAVGVASSLIEREICLAEDWLEDQEIVERAITTAQSSPIVVLPRFAPWQELVINHSDAEVVVFPDGRSGTWVVQTVPERIGENSPALMPNEWGGKRDLELEALSGIEGAVFCHKGLFMFVATTKEGALEAADRVLL